MNIGQCSICLANFTAADMAVLRQCMHTFHRHCIDRAVRIRRECPLCRGTANMTDICTPLLNAAPVPKDLSKQALDIALGYYDKIVLVTAAGQPSSSTANKNADIANPPMMNIADQREQLQACLVGLISTLEDRAEEKEEEWQHLLDFIKVAGLAAACAIFALLCYLYWPLIAPLAGRMASACWSLIVSLCNLLRDHLPEVVGAICALMQLFVVWKGSDLEVAEEQQQGEEEEA